MADSGVGHSEPRPGPPLFVPVVFEREHIEHLLGAARAVLVSCLEAKRPEAEYAPLKEAMRRLEDAFDKKRMQVALAQGGSVGEIMLDRIQRQLGEEIPDA